MAAADKQFAAVDAPAGDPATWPNAATNISEAVQRQAKISPRLINFGAGRARQRLFMNDTTIQAHRPPPS